MFSKINYQTISACLMFQNPLLFGESIALKQKYKCQFKKEKTNASLSVVSLRANNVTQQQGREATSQRLSHSASQRCSEQ
jgi:hypothetical protein